MKPIKETHPTVIKNQQKIIDELKYDLKDKYGVEDVDFLECMATDLLHRIIQEHTIDKEIVRKVIDNICGHGACAVGIKLLKKELGL